MEKTVSLKQREFSPTDPRETRRKYESLVSKAPVGFLSLDENGVIHDINYMGANFLGAQPHDLIGQSFLEHVHRDDQQVILAHLEGAGVGPMKTESEIRLVGRKNFLQQVSLLSYWRYDSHQKRDLCEITLINITHRKNIELELKTTQLFLDSIVENIPDMIFVKEAQDLKFIRFNKAGEVLLGLSRHNLVGKSDYDFFPKREADYFTSRDRQVLQSHDVMDIPQEPIHTKSRGIRILHTKKVSIRDEKGEPRFLLGISEDITEKRQLEEDVIRATDNERRRIGEELHDNLGQKLLSAGMLLSLLKDNLVSKNGVKIGELERISGIIKEAMTVVRNLARGLYAAELDENDLESAIKELVHTVEISTRIQCSFHWKYPNSSLSGPVALTILRVTQEAINNAVKHSNANKIHVSVFRENNSVHLLVDDDGSGLPDNPEIARGMGLRIMKYRVLTAGGYFDVGKNEQGGTRVRCSFPVLTS